MLRRFGDRTRFSLGPDRGVLAEACVALAVVIAVTCLGLRASDDRFTRVWEPDFPKPPPFLNGPVALLFTNLDGFGAHLVMETGTSSKKTGTVSGDLLGRGGKLLFVPDSKGSKRKGPRGGGVSFIWDVAMNNGYILSEALQGYAPVSSTNLFTQMLAEPDAHGTKSERIEGHACEEQSAVVASSNGASSSFRVWRAADLKGFPLRIALVTDSRPFVLHFSKVRLEVPQHGLFLPPDGFTRFDSAETMLNELYLRTPSTGRKRGDRSDEALPPAGGDGRGPGDRHY